MLDAQQVLYSHVAATLPDSISRRRVVLDALSKVLSARHPAQFLVTLQMRKLDELERADKDMQLKFQQLEAKP